MKFSIFSLFVMVVLAFSACENEFSKGDLKKNDKDKKEECLYLIYPVTWIMPDDSSIIIEDEKEGWAEMKDWYKEHPEVKEKPKLEYPVDIKLKDGEILTVEDEADMIQIKEENCNKDDGE